MDDLAIAEKNFNRNVDSPDQLDMFMKSAKEVRNAFVKKFGRKEWDP